MSGRNGRCFRLKMHQQSPVFQTLYRTRYRFAPIADANRQFPASENFPLINQIILFRKHIFRFELLGISQHYGILLRIDFQHISWFSQCDFKSFPLPDGIVRKALMLSQLHSFRIDKPSRAYFIVYLRRMLTQEVPIISFYEAYFHALSFLSFRCIAFIPQIIAHLHLGIGSQREKTTSQDILPQAPKEIRLVFLIVIPGNYIYFPIQFFQTGIVPGSNIPAIQFIRPLR